MTATLCLWEPLGMPVMLWGSTPCRGCSQAEQPSRAQQEGFFGGFSILMIIFSSGLLRDTRDDHTGS